MPIRVYDTLRRAKHPLEPVRPGEVHMYVCGMTVQGPPHVGHLRAAVVADVIRRYLVFSGYRVTLIHNFTDVDDKIIERARAEGTDYWEVANRNIEAYLEAMRRLNVEPPSVMPRASEHIEGILELIRKLIDRGYAYATPTGDVYFEVSRFERYGRLSGRRVEELIAGARVEIGEDKRHPADFALWKAARPGEPSWPSPWGEGRPGWHIECSAMAMHHSGETIDLHGGGMDLVFPHHENELAQAEAVTGVPFVRHWVQHGLVNLSGEKMSKSTDHFFLAADVFDRVDPAVVRYYLMTTHYRSPIEFSEERLAEAGVALDRLRAFVESGGGPAAGDLDGAGETDPALEELITGTRDRFRVAMDDDFNTARALGVVFELLRETHRLGAGQDGGTVPAVTAAVVAELLAVLGVPPVVAPATTGVVPEEARALLEEREKARAARDWARADALREAIEALGYTVKDRPGGSELRRRRPARSRG